MRHLLIIAICFCFPTIAFSQAGKSKTVVEKCIEIDTNKALAKTRYGFDTCSIKGYYRHDSLIRILEYVQLNSTLDIAKLEYDFKKDTLTNVTVETGTYTARDMNGQANKASYAPQASYFYTFKRGRLVNVQKELAGIVFKQPTEKDLLTWSKEDKALVKAKRVMSYKR
jgi:hypothetical protein